MVVRHSQMSSGREDHGCVFEVDDGVPRKVQNSRDFKHRVGVGDVAASPGRGVSERRERDVGEEAGGVRQSGSVELVVRIGDVWV